MCHSQHHGTELFVAICVGISIVKRYKRVPFRSLYGTELF